MQFECYSRSIFQVIQATFQTGVEVVAVEFNRIVYLSSSSAIYGLGLHL